VVTNNVVLYEKWGKKTASPSLVTSNATNTYKVASKIINLSFNIEKCNRLYKIQNSIYNQNK